MTLQEARADFERLFKSVYDGDPGALDTQSGLPYVTVLSPPGIRGKENAIALWCTEMERYWQSVPRAEVLVWRLHPSFVLGPDKRHIRVRCRVLIRAAGEVSEHTSTSGAPMTFDDHLRAAQAKEPASMHELASLLTFQKSELQATLTQIARGREDCSLPMTANKARAMARTSLRKIGVAW